MSAQAKKFARGHVSPSGRLSLPAEFRKAVGLERGGNVIVELDGKDIRIRTIAEAVARAQAMSRRLLAGKPNLSVDDFLAHRREDWGEE
jgi:bifunctional DNA-binding transcriptional regulator/antitoxin component of YhaV-PrlF toxin-antitoxin module